MTLLDYYHSVRGSLDYDLHSSILFKRTLKSRTLGDVDSKYTDPTVTNPVLANVPLNVSDVSYKTAYVSRPALDLVEDQRQRLHSYCRSAAKKPARWAYATRSRRAQSATELRSSRAPSRPQSGHIDGSQLTRPKSSVHRLDSATARATPRQSRPGSERATNVRATSAYSQRSAPAASPPVRSRSPREVKRSRTILSTSSSWRQEPPDPIYQETTRALTESRTKIRSHHHERNHSLAGGVFVRGGPKRENSSVSAETPKQWLSFGGGVRNSAGLVDAFAVMKNPEEYYSIEGQSGLAVAKHLRKMDKVLVGINGNPSPNFANRLEGKRLSDNDWYDKDHVDELIRQAEALRVAASMNGEAVPLCWEDQLAVPEIKTVEAKSADEGVQAAKTTPRETTAVVFKKLETDRPQSCHLITPTKHQTAEAAGFKVHRRTKAFTKPSTSDTEAIMTIISIDTEKLSPAEAVDYEAFIDEKIPTKQYRRRPTPEVEVEAKPPRQESRTTSYSQTSLPPSSHGVQEARVLVRPTSRSIRLGSLDDEDFAVMPVRSKRLPIAQSPSSTKDRAAKNSGRLRRGKSNLGKTAPSIASKYEQGDTSFIKIAEGIASPPLVVTGKEPKKPPTTPENTVILPEPGYEQSVPSDTEDDMPVPAPSLNDDSEVESARKSDLEFVVLSKPIQPAREDVEKEQEEEEEGRMESTDTKSTEPAITIPVADEEDNAELEPTPREQETAEELETVDEPEMVETETEQPEMDEAETEEPEVAEGEKREVIEEGDVAGETEMDETEIKEPEVEIKKEKRLRFDV